jgi:hypothetical protein
VGNLEKEPLNGPNVCSPERSFSGKDASFLQHSIGLARDFPFMAWDGIPEDVKTKIAEAV